MTLKVYEVNRVGTIKLLRPTTVVEPAVTVEPSAAFPDCQCPRHRYARTDAAYRAYVTHTQLCATCRAGASCPTVARLGREWKRTR